jgi:hypothetical protein
LELAVRNDHPKLQVAAEVSTGVEFCQPDLLPLTEEVPDAGLGFKRL